MSAARWLAEAWESGNPLAPLPPELIPADGEAVAIALCEALGLTPCGVRIVLGTHLAGPMLEARLHRDDAVLALTALRHARATAAVVGVLGAALEPAADTPLLLAALHPAIDVAASRFTTLPVDAAVIAADLAGLGAVVAGRAKPPPAASVPVSLGAAGARRRGTPVDLAAAFAAAAAAARRFGGLPAGALLVVAGLTPIVVPRAAESLVASLGRLGSVRAAFAGDAG